MLGYPSVSVRFSFSVSVPCVLSLPKLLHCLLVEKPYWVLREKAFVLVETTQECVGRPAPGSCSAPR